MYSQKQGLFTGSLQSLKHHCIITFKTLTPHISCLAVHNNLLYAASMNEINVYDLSSYTLIDAFNNDSTSGFVKSIAFNDTKIITAHQDCKIKVWQITQSKHHQLISTLPTAKDRFLRCMLPKNYVHVRRHKKRLWIEHWDAVSGLVVNEGLMYSISWDKSFKIWNMENHQCLESVKAHEDAINAIAVTASGTVYTASADGRIRVWERVDNMKKHTLVSTLNKHKSTVNALVLNSDGSMLFSGGCDHSILVWEREDSAQHMVFVEAMWGHSGAVLCLINVDDLLVSGSSDRTVRIWKRGNKSRYCCIAVLEGHEKPVKSLVVISRSLSKGLVMICSGSLGGEIKVWEIGPLLQYS